MEEIDDPESDGGRRRFKTQDKPLSFHWRVVNTDLIKSLELPAAPSRRHEKARAAIIVDAIRTGLLSPEQFISYSRNNSFYAAASRYEGTHYTRTTVPWAVDNLDGLGLVEHDRARVGDLGNQSKFRATPALLGVVKEPLVIVQVPPFEPIVMRNADKRATDFRETEATMQMRRRVEAINEAVGSVDIDLKAHDARAAEMLARAFKYRDKSGADRAAHLGQNQYHRTFNESWQEGGRFYGPAWQSLPGELRADITMNGAATVEHDYQGLHPQLIYAKAGKILEGDPYTIPGWEDQRRLVKLAFNIMVNADTEQAAVRALALHGSRAYSLAREVITAVRQHHAAVAQFFCSGIGRRLQRMDSDIAEDVHLTTQRDGTAVLSVHDSFIAPESYEGRLQEVMDAALTKRLRKENPDLLAPHQGAPRVVMVIPHGAEPDMFQPKGYEMPRAELETWRGGTMPPSIRAAVRHEMKRRGVIQDAMAAELGISRPQLTNALQGRFGLGEGPAAKVRTMLEAAERGLSA